MYSDIIPPKKNSFIKAKKSSHEVTRILKNEPILTQRPIYHTIDGRDRRSKLPIILTFITLAILAIVYYSVFNNKTQIFFESKTVIFEVKDNISMILSEKNQNSSTTLSYNLIYSNENKDRNIFAPIDAQGATSTEKAIAKTDSDFYTLNATSTAGLAPKKVKFINETSNNVQIIENTRIDVGGVTYYLDRKADIKPTAKEEIGSSTDRYKVIGFKNTNVYDRFYAIDYVGTAVTLSNDAETDKVQDKNIPSNDILSLIPENFIPLKKGYVFDQSINQSALVVIDKKDFEKVLKNNSKLIQEYVKVFKPIADLVEYEIHINDYDIELSPETGLPTSFKNLNLEITPRIKRDKVASVFKGFSKETIKSIKTEIQKHINMEVRYSPFWISKVSDEDHISVEVK